MTRRPYQLSLVVGVVILLLGGQAPSSAGPESDYADLARMLNERFPAAKSLAGQRSAANFVPDPTIAAPRLGPRPETIRRGQVRRVEKNHVLLQLAPGAGADDVKRLLEENHLKITGGVPQIGLLDLELQDKPEPPPGWKGDRAALAEDSEILVKHLNATLRRLRLKYPNLVHAAAPNVLMGPVALPPDSKCKGQDLQGLTYFWDWGEGPDSPASIQRDGNWGQKYVRFPGAWNFVDAIKRRNPAPIDVGVLDAGFNEHENLSFTRSPLTKPLIANHGNHVLGIIGARWNTPNGVRGCTPFARMHACSIPVTAAAEGKIPPLFMAFSDVVATLLDFIAQTPNLKVINLSLGYNWVAYETENPNTSPRIHDYVRAHGVMVRSVADLAAAKGILIVSAAGNDSDADLGYPNIDAQYSSPLNWAAMNQGTKDRPAANILVVEAVSRSGNLWAFSNVNGRLAAPGEGILGTAARRDPFDELEFTALASAPSGKAYAVYNGTSMAAPHVTGLIALMYAYNNALKMEEVVKILDETADRNKNPGHAPVIDAFAALLECGPVDQVLRDLADLNNDGKVDMADFQIFKQAFKQVKGGGQNVFPRADLNGSGRLSTDADDRRPLFRKPTQQLQDLEVLMRAWPAGNNVKPADLQRLLLEP